MNAKRSALRLIRPNDQRPQDPVAVYLSGLTPRSRKTQTGTARALARLLGYPTAQAVPWAQLSHVETQALRGAAVEKYAPKTANGLVSLLKQVLRESWRLGMITAEQLARAIDLQPVPGRRMKPMGRLVSQAELTQLFEVCGHDQSLFGLRDTALLAILYCTGIRAFEAGGLAIDDYDPATGHLHIRKGKGAKSREAWIGTESGRRAVAQWLEVRGRKPGPLLAGFHRRGVLLSPLRRMTAESVRAVLVRRCCEAGILRATPHGFRATAITHVLEALAGDLDAAQRFAGHSNVATTTLYVRRDQGIVQRAAATLEVPESEAVARGISAPDCKEGKGA